MVLRARVYSRMFHLRGSDMYTRTRELGGLRLRQKTVDSIHPNVNVPGDCRSRGVESHVARAIPESPNPPARLDSDQGGVRRAIRDRCDDRARFAYLAGPAVVQVPHLDGFVDATYGPLHVEAVANAEAVEISPRECRHDFDEVGAPQVRTIDSGVPAADCARVA